MYLLRRAAARAITQQSNAFSRTCPSATTHLTSLAPVARTPIACRGFHLARICRAEVEHKGELAQAGEESLAESQSAEETVTEEPSVQEQAEEVREESVAAPDIADAAEAAPGQSMTQQAQKFASSAASSTVNAAVDAFDATAGTARSERPSRRSIDSVGTHRNPVPSRILYIGNLFFEVTAQQLQSEFATFGRVTNSRIVTDARGLSKGFGYIEMETQEGADTAVRELDQKVFQGRRMAVQYHVRRAPGTKGARNNNTPMPPSKTLFIGNMSYQMSDRDLNDLFREIRDVLDVRVAIDRRSGQPRGFAHADFIDVGSAQRAKEHLEKKVVYGRQLRVDFSASTPSQPSRE